MARDNIPEYSATASANTVVADVNIDEGCAPSGINNAIREVMSALKKVDTGATTLTSPAFTTSTSATIKTATVKHTNDTASMTIAANGAVTFNQALSLPDNTVETADVQDNAITLAKMAGLTRGSIIYGNASGDPTALPIGTGILKGNGTDISYVAEAGGGTEFIATADANNSATISFTGFDASKYDSYLFTFSNVISANDNATLILLTSTNGGSSYDSGGGDYYFQYFGYRSGALGHESSTGTTSIFVAPYQGTASGEVGGMSGHMFIYGPHITQHTRALGQTFFYNSSGDIANFIIGGARKSNADVDAAQFKYNSGNISSGTINLYGFKNA